MKILFIDYKIPHLINDEKYPVGGATVQALNWIKGLIMNNVDASVIVENGNHTNKLPVEYVSAFEIKKGIPIVNWITNRYKGLDQAVKKNNPDFIYQAGAGFLTWISWFIAKKNSVKFIHRIANDVDTDSRIKLKLNFIKRKFYLSGLKRADVILCQNDYQFHNIKSMLTTKNVFKITNPFDLDAVPRLETSDRRYYIAWIGVFHSQKNLRALVKIVEQLPDLDFCIAGKMSAYADNKTIAAVEKLHSYKNVKFVGYLNRKEILHFLCSAKLLLNTSLYEGFSNTFLEALSVGTPVVTTKLVDPDNIIEKFNLGIVCSDYEEIPESIIKISDGFNFEEFYERSKNYLLENHEKKILAGKLLQILTNIN